MTALYIELDYWSSLCSYKFIFILEFGATQPNNDNF